MLTTVFKMTRQPLTRAPEVGLTLGIVGDDVGDEVWDRAMIRKSGKRRPNANLPRNRKKLSW